MSNYKSKVDPTKALAFGSYHFHPRWTHNYGDSVEKRIEEFEDVVKTGYFNSITVEVSYLNNDEFWRVILENDATVWLNVYDSFDSTKQPFDEWAKPFTDALAVLQKNPERWERFLGFHFDEPIWRGQANGDFLTTTKEFTEMYHKRIFPVFACGEFSDSEGNAMQIKLDAAGMKKVMPEALKYVTDIGFDSYSVDVRDGYPNGDYIDRVNQKMPTIVDGKSYYEEYLKLLLRVVGHDVKVWFFPCTYTTGLWSGGRADEDYCLAHVKFFYDLLKKQKHQGGIVAYTYYQFSNPKELGLQSHLVVKDENGNIKLRPEEDKWYKFSDYLKNVCEEFKNTEAK